MKKYHIVYRTHNLINGKEYTGKHSTNDLNDGYYGSGSAIHSAVKKYGIENFAVEIISFHESEEAALAEEERIVDEEYVWRDDTYNISIGGDGKLIDTIVSKDIDGKCHIIHKTDDRFISGELVGINKGKITVKDKDGNTMQVSIDDPRRISGELIPESTGRAIFKLDNGKNVSMRADIARELGLQHINSNTVLVKDNNGNASKVKIDDPRYLSGELISYSKNTFNAKDKAGNIFKIQTDDPRYLSGELVGIMKGRTFKKKNEPRCLCPHCGKEGNVGNMKRWHFDNCKAKL